MTTPIHGSASGGTEGSLFPVALLVARQDLVLACRRNQLAKIAGTVGAAAANTTAGADQDDTESDFVNISAPPSAGSDAFWSVAAVINAHQHEMVWDRAAVASASARVRDATGPPEANRSFVIRPLQLVIEQAGKSGFSGGRVDAVRVAGGGPGSVPTKLAASASAPYYVSLHAVGEARSVPGATSPPSGFVVVRDEPTFGRDQEFVAPALRLPVSFTSEHATALAGYLKTPERYLALHWKNDKTPLTDTTGSCASSFGDSERGFAATSSASRSTFSRSQGGGGSRERPSQRWSRWTPWVGRRLAEVGYLMGMDSLMVDYAMWLRELLDFMAVSARVLFTLRGACHLLHVAAGDCLTAETIQRALSTTCDGALDDDSSDGHCVNVPWEDSTGTTANGASVRAALRGVIADVRRALTGGVVAAPPFVAPLNRSGKRLATPPLPIGEMPTQCPPSDYCPQRCDPALPDVGSLAYVERQVLKEFLLHSSFPGVGTPEQDGQPVAGGTRGDDSERPSTRDGLATQALQDHLARFVYPPRAPQWQPDVECQRCPECSVSLTGVASWLSKTRSHCRCCGRVICVTCAARLLLPPHLQKVSKPAAVAADGADLPCCGTCGEQWLFTTGPALVEVLRLAKVDVAELHMLMAVDAGWFHAARAYKIDAASCLTATILECSRKAAAVPPPMSPAAVVVRMDAALDYYLRSLVFAPGVAFAPVTSAAVSASGFAVTSPIASERRDETQQRRVAWEALLAAAANQAPFALLPGPVTLLDVVDHHLTQLAQQSAAPPISVVQLVLQVFLRRRIVTSNPRTLLSKVRSSQWWEGNSGGGGSNSSPQGGLCLDAGFSRAVHRLLFNRDAPSKTLSIVRCALVALEAALADVRWYTAVASIARFVHCAARAEVTDAQRSSGGALDVATTVFRELLTSRVHPNAFGLQPCISAARLLVGSEAQAQVKTIATGEEGDNFSAGALAGLIRNLLPPAAAAGVSQRSGSGLVNRVDDLSDAAWSAAVLIGDIAMGVPMSHLNLGAGEEQLSASAGSHQDFCDVGVEETWRMQRDAMRLQRSRTVQSGEGCPFDDDHTGGSVANAGLPGSRQGGTQKNTTLRHVFFSLAIDAASVVQRALGSQDEQLRRTNAPLHVHMATLARLLALSPRAPSAAPPTPQKAAKAIAPPASDREGTAPARATESGSRPLASVDPLPSPPAPIASSTGNTPVSAAEHQQAITPPANGGQGDQPLAPAVTAASAAQLATATIQGSEAALRYVFSHASLAYLIEDRLPWIAVLWLVALFVLFW